MRTHEAHETAGVRQLRVLMEYISDLEGSPESAVLNRGGCWFAGLALLVASCLASRSNERWCIFDRVDLASNNECR